MLINFHVNQFSCLLKKKHFAIAIDLSLVLPKERFVKAEP